MAHSAGVESISCVVVVVDEAGQITALEGADGRYGITADCAGRNWNQAFDGWGLPKLPLPPEHRAFESLQTYATAPTGDATMVEMMPIPSRAGDRQTLIRFRNACDGSIVDRQQQLCGLGEISASVGHEINNALTLLIGWLDLLLADFKEDPKLSPTLELLMGEANRIGQLTSNLLDVARGERQETKELDVQRVLDEVMGLVRYDMQHSNIELESNLPERLPPIMGSSGRLKQALLNLLLNARQAMPSGGRVTVSAEKSDNGSLSVAVEDTGCGIPDELQSRIFSPFFTTKANGTGLGLSVTRRIVEDHGGNLEMKSQVGKGTRFTLRLPMVAG